MKKIFLAFCICLSAPVWSQISVEVLVSNNRMLSRLSELEELANSSQLVIRLRNSTPLRQNVQLEMRLTSPQTSFSIHTNRDAAPSFFSINAFDTRTLNVSDLNELFDQNSFVLGDGRPLGEFLVADPTGQVPSGQYRLCVRVVPESLTPPQSASFQSEGCTNITFQQFNPPLINLINNYPYSEGVTVPKLSNPNAPFPITFTPPISVLTNPVNILFKYTLCIVELFENDQRDPNQVLQAVIDGKEPRGIVVRKEILNSPAGQAQITANLLPEDFSAPFQLAQNYAVAVLAELQGTTTAELLNGGLSPICQFQYGRRTVVNRPLTGRKGLDTFIKILNNLDGPNKSATELLTEAFTELGRSKVSMKANKTCYSTPNAVLCLKLDSLYDVKYPNRGLNNFMKLITNDLADDMGIGDAFNICSKDGSVKGFNLQRVGSLTAGPSAFMQRPSAQDVFDRMTSGCGESFGAGGGDRSQGSSECTDCYVDEELAKVIATGSIDQLNPIVQAINEMCSQPTMADVPQGNNGAIGGGNSGIKNSEGVTPDNNSNTSESSSYDEKVQQDNTDLVLDLIDTSTTVIDGIGSAATGNITEAILSGVEVGATVLGYSKNENVSAVANSAGHLGTFWGAIKTGEAILVTGIEGVSTAVGASIGLGIVAIAIGGYQFIRGLEEEQKGREERVRKANEEGAKRTGNTKYIQLTLDAPNPTREEHQKKVYDLKKRFGRLGWGDALGGGNGGGSEDPTGTDRMPTGNTGNKNIPPVGLKPFICSMVDKCNQDGWGTQQCRGFMASFNCVKGVDNRMIYTDPDAFSDGRGCGAPPNKNKYGCTEKMIGQPGPDNLTCAKIAANKAFLAKILNKGKDPRFTDPVDPNSGIDIPTGGGKKGPGPDPRLNPQSTSNPQSILGSPSSPTTPTNAIPKPAIDKSTVPKPNGAKNNNDPNKNRKNR